MIVDAMERGIKQWTTCSLVAKVNATIVLLVLTKVV